MLCYPGHYVGGVDMQRGMRINGGLYQILMMAFAVLWGGCDYDCDCDCDCDV